MLSLALERMNVLGLANAQIFAPVSRYTVSEQSVPFPYACFFSAHTDAPTSSPTQTTSAPSLPPRTRETQAFLDFTSNVTGYFKPSAIANNFSDIYDLCEYQQKKSIVDWSDWRFRNYFTCHADGTFEDLLIEGTGTLHWEYLPSISNLKYGDFFL